MGPYFALAASVGVLASTSEFVRRRLRTAPAAPSSHGLTYFDLIAIAVLVGFSALRHNVGTDYWIYAAIYDRVDPTRWGQAIATSSQEVGFTVLMLAVKSVTDSPYAIFWVVAALTVVPVYFVIKRHSQNVALSIMLYVLLAYYAGSFNQMRQSLALALLLTAWSLFVRRKVSASAVVAILAGSMHVTALLAAVVLLLVRRWRPTVGMATLVVGGGVLVGLSLIQFGGVVNLLSLINPRYGEYVSSGDTGLGAYLQILATISLLIFSASIGGRYHPLTESQREMVMYVLIGVAFMLIGTQAVVLFRMSQYFTVFLVLLVPNRISGSRDRLLSGGLIVCAGLAYYAAHLTNYGDVIPYRTYLGL